MKIDAGTVARYAERYADNICPAGMQWPYANLFFTSHIHKELTAFAFANVASMETPLILVDNTACGPSKSGILLTDTHIHYMLPYSVTEERRVKGSVPISDMDTLDFIPTGTSVDVDINGRHIGALASLNSEELQAIKTFFSKLFGKELGRVIDATNSIAPSAGAMAPSQEAAEVIEKLRDFDRHQQAFCLYCGYDGLMGVEKRWLPWYLTWWVIIPLLITSIGWVVAIALWWQRGPSLKFRVRCPHCNTGLETL